MGRTLEPRGHEISSSSWFVTHWMYGVIKNHLISEDLGVDICEILGRA